MSWWGAIDATFVMAKGSKRDPFDGMPVGSEWEWGEIEARTPSADHDEDERALRERRPYGFHRYQIISSVSGGARLRDFIDADDAAETLAWVQGTCGEDVVEADVVVEFDGGPRYVWRYVGGVLSRVHGVLDQAAAAQRFSGDSA